MMIAHTTLHVSDYAKSKAFYTQVLVARSDITRTWSTGNQPGSTTTNTDFWISAEDSVVSTHLAYEARSREQVQAFHKIAIESGAKDHGRPGYRDYSPGNCAAFVIDPNGHNIEAVRYDPARER
jgi:catechol 2,3-dioxygenase-like lactoylglutathione lyase family enzyme